MARSDYTHRIEVNCETGEASQVALTTSEIDAAVESEEAIAAEVAANGYKRRRAAAFASIGDQLDMQYKDQLNGTTTWKDHIAKVKSDHPKP
mgnify:FL=1